MITDFLKTNRTRDELRSALEVIREFKECESENEWLMIPFAAWTKLEQLEEFLAHLVEDKPLEEDTIRYMKSEPTSPAPKS
jgi:hypothetical protein